MRGNETIERLWVRITARMSPVVFFGSAVVVIAFVVTGAAFTKDAVAFFRATQQGAAQWFGWYYVLVVTALLVLVVSCMVTRVRHVRLGGADAKPEFSRAGWLAMLFAAGMGIGLVYFGVAEPLLHYAEPPRAEPRTPEALREAMRLAFFHWGLHAWGIYAMLALAVAHAHFNRNLPLAPSSALEPLIGERHRGPIGQGVDILCTVGTLLGVATSLGLGAMQINASLELFFGIPDALMTQLAIIGLITFVATLSVVAGVQAGLRRLSLINIGLAALLLLFVLAAGPTLYVTELLVSTVGSYLQELPRLSLYLDPGVKSEWQTDWTLFYWGWWISWSPFVAIFVARISRGRTVGEFALGVLIVPPAVTFLWLATFGGTALWMESTGDDAGLVKAVQENNSASLQALLEQLPFTTVAAVLATAVIALFFVTSSDSGSLVDDMVTSGGHPHPPRAQRVFWATSEGAAAATLLVLGGLEAIRNAAISLGLPMSFVLVATAIPLLRTLREDPMAASQPA